MKTQKRLLDTTPANSKKLLSDEVGSIF